MRTFRTTEPGLFGSGAVTLCALLLAASAAQSQQVFTSGNLLVTTSTYGGTAGLITPGVTLLAGATAPQTVTATANGSYSQVFNNVTADAAFGVTSRITVQQLTPSGSLVSTVSIAGAVTSFSSKSEMGIQPTSDGTGVTFMGYFAPANAIDVSNSNTAAVDDPTNPVTNSQFGGPYSRAIITLNSDGTSSITPVSAYSGNNGREAILNSGYYYLVGNAGNSGSGPTVATMDALSANTGAQLLAFGGAGATTVDGELTSASLGHSTGDQYGFSITQIGDAADKTGKDDNFRGEVIFNNTLYVTKGSGSNGVNTVYQVGTAGSLPTAATASATVITILPGFSKILAKGTQSGTIYYPFDLFFADANTLYVADEGGQVTTDEVGGSTYTTNTGGLQKWLFDGTQWNLAYTLTAGLNLGAPYAVSGTVTDSTGSVTQYPDGLRHLAGVVNNDGTVTIYATTSTVGGLADQGASPNQLVVITDTLANLNAAEASGESFSLLETAAYGQVLRGVNFVPVVLPSTGVTPMIAASASTIPPGGTSSLTVTPSGTGPFTYQWYQGTSGNSSAPLSGATSASFTTPSLASTTAYWAQITTASGIVENSGTVTVTVTGTSGATDGPLPLWALVALGAGLTAVASRRLNKAA